MDLGLQDKGVLVMASSGGIGKGVAREFSREGARVMLFARDEAKLARTADEIGRETGNPPLFVSGDITKRQDVERAVTKTSETFGGIWALFNNTGGPPSGTFEAFDDAAWQGAFESTLLGYIRTIRACLPHLRAGKGGRIVNNASASTKQAIDSLILSNTFRSGLVGLGKSLARELGRDGILVNTLGAGRIDTDRVTALDQLWAGQKGIAYEEQRKQSENAIPAGVYGRPEDFGRIAVFLCSPANSYLTGQSILIDGGLTEAY